MATSHSSRLSGFSRALPWLSALVLIAGVVAFVVVKVAGDNGSSSTSATPAASSQSGTKASSGAKAATGTKSAAATKARAGAATKKAQLANFDASAKDVAGKFILTAVQRKNLAQAWPLAGPNIRAGTTYKEWLTGDIAVVPFLDPIKGASYRLTARHANALDLQVLLYAKNPKKVPIPFEMTLQRVGAGKARHWVVNNWWPSAGGGIVPNGGSR
jgi:hypothetical protein